MLERILVSRVAMSAKFVLLMISFARGVGVALGVLFNIACSQWQRPTVKSVIRAGDYLENH